jgi:predicted nuclease with TOPRIM domain
MSEVTRTEIETLHGRISDLKERVVNLEAQQPHINAALLRIEGSVGKVGEQFEERFDRLTKKIGNVAWAFIVPLIALIVGVIFKVIFSGALAHYI